MNFTVLSLSLLILLSAVDPSVLFRLVFVFFQCLAFSYIFSVEILILFMHCSPDLSEHLYDHYFELYQVND